MPTKGTGAANALTAEGMYRKRNASPNSAHARRRYAHYRHWAPARNDSPPPNSTANRLLALYNTIKSVLLNAVIILLVFLIVHDAYVSIVESSIIIQPFVVSDDAAKSGYDGKVISNKLLDQIHTINQVAHYNKALPFISNWEQEDAKIEIPGTGIPFHLVSNRIKDLLGRKNSYVAGDVYKSEGNVYVATRVNGYLCVNEVAGGGNIDLLLNETAQKIIGQIQPVLLFRYQAQVDKKCVACIPTLQLALRNQSTDDDVDAYLGLGWVLVNRQLYDAAIEQYKLAAKLEPYNIRVYSNWGVALHNKRQYKLADAKYKEAEPFTPKTAQYYSNWAATLLEINLDEAIEKSQKALALDAADTLAMKSAGYALYQQRKYAEALAMYQRIRMRYPFNAENNENIAYCVSALKKPK